MKREVWIDREFAQNSPYRVRELCGTETMTLATFAVLDAAERFVAELEHSELDASVEKAATGASRLREMATSH